MTRSAKVAIFITAAVVVCVFAACGVALALKDWVPGLAGCADPTKPTKTAVFTEPARIEQMYPELKPVRAVHWQEHEAVARSCPQVGTMRYEMDGLVQITPERAADLAAQAPSAPPQSPEIPGDLRPFAPQDPHWQPIGEGLLLNRESATVYFVHLSA
ncbi:hypothetical protein [Dactylosporangium salmoneum]|uniref:Uncharacterized protein n=1 Tax=Dactylosporangium salmoneum TaxID=53361 RepID=A0ABN3HEL4_9ACTN